MAYDEALAERVRKALAGTKGVTEKKMFGGTAFLVGGAMCVGVDKTDLIIRCEKDDTDLLLKKRGVRIFDLSGGRPMKGWLLVGSQATRSAAGLSQWVEFALEWTRKSAKASPIKKAAKTPTKRARAKP
jgi:TfoX/Sxy family transcriptional regulator of competence genes